MQNKHYRNILFHTESQPKDLDTVLYFSDIENLFIFNYVAISHVAVARHVDIR